MTHTTVSPLVLVALACALGVSLSGCSAIDNVLHNESSEAFASTAELTDGWENTAAWVPADAVDIQIQESTDGETAVLRATTGTALDPAVCAETERRSIPVFEQTWTPEDILVDRAFACGGWTVIPTGDGWFGWTPNAPDEQAHSPRP